MPSRPAKRPLGLFLEALHEEKIPCLLIGMMAAAEQGAPVATIDYDLWVDLPERQYVRLLNIVRKQAGTIRAATLYELRDGAQVNVVFHPDGLRSFRAEYRASPVARLEGGWVRVLPLARVIASKKAAGREKDLASLPVLRQALRLQRHLKKR